jgi:hypothetical protein
MARDIRPKREPLRVTPELVNELKDRLSPEARELLEMAATQQGTNGPYDKSVRVTFDMLHVKVQDFLLRIDEKDLEDLQWAIKLGFWGRWAIKGLKYVAYAFTGGLAAAVLAGENFSKLIAMISNAVSVLRGFGK